MDNKGIEILEFGGVYDRLYVDHSYSAGNPAKVVMRSRRQRGELSNFLFE